MGQYTQVDPIGLAGGNPTLYGYVFNPFANTDIYGLLPTNPADRQAIRNILGALRGNGGVYQFIDAGGGVYTGKADNLYRRLYQHLRDGKRLLPSNINSIRVHVPLVQNTQNYFNLEDLIMQKNSSQSANSIASPGNADNFTGEIVTKCARP